MYIERRINLIGEKRLKKSRLKPMAKLTQKQLLVTLGI